MSEFESIGLSILRARVIGIIDKVGCVNEKIAKESGVDSIRFEKFLKGSELTNKEIRKLANTINELEWKSRIDSMKVISENEVFQHKYNSFMQEGVRSNIKRMYDSSKRKEALVERISRDTNISRRRVVGIIEFKEPYSIEEMKKLRAFYEYYTTERNLYEDEFKVL